MFINVMEKTLEGNLFRLYFIKFLLRLNHSGLVMEDRTCKSTPSYA